MLRNKILKDTVLLNVSAVVSQGLTILQSLLVMRFLDPAAYGIWLGLNILLVYSGYVHLGLEHGLGVRLPYYKGQGNSERERQIEDTVYVAWTGLTLLFAAGVLVYALMAPQRSSVVRLGLAIMAGLILLEQQMRYLSRWQTSSRKDFTVLSSTTILRSVLSFLLIVPLAYFFNVKGVMVGAFVVAVAMLVFWKVQTPYRIRWQLSSEVLWEMLRIGFPIMLVVLGGMLIETVDRLLILGLLGTASLGYYGVTGLGGNFLYGLFAQAGSAVSPHIAEEMGRSGDSAQSQEKFLVKPTLVCACLAVMLIMALVFVIPPMVTLVLRKYVPGLPAFYLFVPGFFFLSIIVTANNILNVILIAQKRQRLVVYIQTIAIIIEAASAVLFIRLGWNIAGAALASTLSYAFYGLSILTYATCFVIPQRPRQLRFLFDVVAPFVYAVVVSMLIVWLGQQWLSKGPVLRAVVQLALCGVAYVPIMYWLNVRVGFLKEMLPVIEAAKTRIRAAIPKPI